jgi:hypothetical protein
MTGIMPYPKRQKTASRGGFKGKTPRASKIRHFSRQKPLFIRLKRVFAVSHFAHSDCLILLARQHHKAAIFIKKPTPPHILQHIGKIKRPPELVGAF